MRRSLSLFTVLMLCGILAFAQNRVVSGKVSDEQGNPVPFATILVKGSSAGTKADENGVFTIKNLKADAILVISSSSYANKEYSTSGKTFITASLAKSAATGLQEVVVTTALGQVRQKASLGYSTATIRGAELTQGRATNLQNGLTGKVSGLQVNTVNSGVTGGNTRLTLRGIRSLTGNNQPMLIVDGVSIGLGYMSSINPNDIAEVSILKSAAATVVYGPEGVNGAIVIVTRKGSKLKPMITISHSTQWESISYMPKFQKRWGSGYDQDPNTGEGTYYSGEQQSWGDEFDGSIRALGEGNPFNGDSMHVPYSYVKNGRRNFFATGVTNQTDVSYSTGDFYLSGQNVSIKGVLPGDEDTRRALTFRSEKEYDKFKAIFNVRYTQSKYNVTTANRLVYYDVTGAPGEIDLAKFKDWRNDFYSSPDGYYTTFLENNGKTPYFEKDNNRQVGKTDDFFGNLELNYKANSWLNFVYRVGLSISNSDAKSTTGAFTHSAWFKKRGSGPSAPGVAAAVNDDNLYSNRLTSEAFINFNKTFDKIGVSATAGYSFTEARSKELSVGSANLGQSTFLSIAARLGEPAVVDQSFQQRAQRFFGRVSLDYDKWAFLEGTASYDMDSRLALNGNTIPFVSKVGFFYPGLSASILLHEVIPGFKENKIINYLKLRGSISKTGNANALAPYQNETTFSNGTFFPYGSIPGYQINTTVYPKAGLNPEFVNNKEVGIELGFLKNRINLEATYYSQNNTGQILNVQLSNTTGATTALLNAGAFINKGLELDLKLTPLVRIKKVSIDVKANYLHSTNKVTSLIDGVNELGVGNFQYAIVGSSAYTFKLTDYIRDSLGHIIVANAGGYFPGDAPGKPSGKAGMPKANSNTTAFGHNLPDDILGLSVNVNWKGLSFSATAEYRGGNQIVSDDLGAFMDDNGISARSGENGRRAFIFPNSVYDNGSGKMVTNTNVYTSSFGRLFYNDELNTDVISNYLSSGAFWKLREVSLSYELPSKLIKWNAIKGITIGVSGRNLLTWVPKSNQWTDPEFGNTTGNAQGRNTASNLPPTRIFGANIVIKL